MELGFYRCRTDLAGNTWNYMRYVGCSSNVLVGLVDEADGAQPANVVKPLTMIRDKYNKCWFYTFIGIARNDRRQLFQAGERCI